MERSGCCLRRGFHNLLLLTCLASAGLSSWSKAAPVSTVTLPAGSLADALHRLADRTGSEIVSLEPGLNHVRIPARDLAGNTQAMLNGLLAGTGYRAVRVASNSFRVERQRATREGPARHREDTPDDPGEIIVTATKFPVPLLRYPGSVSQTVRLSPDQPAARPEDMDDIARQLAVLQNTELGEGRNKIFIRGIADSSFNGATQPTASIYFGDAPIGFGSPSPNLKLYDIARVEVLEGPQGTLYGSGSLGGVIRVAPNKVDTSRFLGAATLGGSATLHGEPGWDGSAMANVPILPDRVGIRMVGYNERIGGYTDNVAGGRDSNSVTVFGGRFALFAHIGESMTVEAGALYQETNGDDAPYANNGQLLRIAQIAEPYSSRLRLGYLIIERQWANGLKLASATSLGTRASRDVFDSTPPPPPQGMLAPAPVSYQLGRDSVNFVNETRLSRHADGGVSWVVGATVQRQRDGQTRSLGVVDAAIELDEVTNITYSLSAFGQASIPLTPAIEVTAGARWTAARTDSEPSRDPRNPPIRGVVARRVDPTLAVAWTLAPRTVVYARLQTGYRNGGMAVARGVGRTANFQSDSVVMTEVGARRLRSGATGLSLSTAFSYTSWNDIQGDLITRRGLPYTANIGDARVFVAESNADWTPVRGLDLSGSLIYTKSRLSGALANEMPARDRRLPLTPLWAGSLRADYVWGDADRTRYRLGGGGRYVGRSVLGAGALLDVSQGDYAVFDVHGGMRRGRIDLSLTIDNLLDTRGNRFAFGNPISFARGNQVVPLQPLTMRLGLGYAW